MNRQDFEAMVRRLCDEVPPEFLDGVAEVTVSARTVPHPSRADVFTLGECIPLPLEAGAAEVQSRIVLYYGSFAALATLDDAFDWRGEAWETLTHELRHHLEWRASAPDLEAFDVAAEQNFARQEGEAFDPVFYRAGERIAEGVYRIEDDWFFERIVMAVPENVTVIWQEKAYRIPVPREATLPAYLTTEGLEPAAPGEVVVVLQRKPGLRSLFGRPEPFEAIVQAQPVELAGGTF